MIYTNESAVISSMDCSPVTSHDPTKRSCIDKDKGEGKKNTRVTRGRHPPSYFGLRYETSLLSLRKPSNPTRYPLHGERAACPQTCALRTRDKREFFFFHTTDRNSRLDFFFFTPPIEIRLTLDLNSGYPRCHPEAYQLV